MKMMSCFKIAKEINVLVTCFSSLGSVMLREEIILQGESLNLYQARFVAITRTKVSQIKYLNKKNAQSQSVKQPYIKI